MHIIKVPHSKLLLVLALPVLTNTAAHAQLSYSITVPANGKFFAAYHFSDKTLAEVLPPSSLPWGTRVDIWNNTSQSYVTQTLDDLDETWTPNPNYVLEAGSVFFIQNPTTSDLNISISGYEITYSKPLSLIAGTNYWNGYAAVRMPADFLECACELNYTTMSFPGDIGDELWWWDPAEQEWRVQERYLTATDDFSWGGGYCDGGTVPDGAPWVTVPGWGTLFRKVQNRTWTYDAPVSCIEE